MNEPQRRMVCALAVALGLLYAGAAAAQAAADHAALDLAKKNGCLTCHGPDQKIVGPSWREVGRKYSGQAGAEEVLVQKVKKGGAGVWGQVPMPPNVTVKDADVRQLVRYVLSLK